MLRGLSTSLSLMRTPPDAAIPTLLRSAMSSLSTSPAWDVATLPHRTPPAVDALPRRHPPTPPSSAAQPPRTRLPNQLGLALHEPRSAMLRRCDDCTAQPARRVLQEAAHLLLPCPTRTARSTLGALQVQAPPRRGGGGGLQGAMPHEGLVQAPAEACRRGGDRRCHALLREARRWEAALLGLSDRRRSSSLPCASSRPPLLLLLLPRRLSPTFLLPTPCRSQGRWR
jgi:hypothetical protein